LAATLSRRPTILPIRSEILLVQALEQVMASINEEENGGILMKNVADLRTLGCLACDMRNLNRKFSV
jgi:hypothetical protein